MRRWRRASRRRPRHRPGQGDADRRRRRARARRERAGRRSRLPPARGRRRDRADQALPAPRAGRAGVGRRGRSRSPSPTAAAWRQRSCAARRCRPPSTTGAPVSGRLVEGPFAAALSEYLGRPVELVAHDDGVTGGDDHAVTLMSDGSLAAVSAALDGAFVDPRRFRMTIAIEGAQAWEEDGWAGREVADRHRHPARRGAHRALRDHHARPRRRPRRPADPARPGGLRGKRDVAFGVWCDVAAPGRRAGGRRGGARLVALGGGPPARPPPPAPRAG